MRVKQFSHSTHSYCSVLLLFCAMSFTVSANNTQSAARLWVADEDKVTVAAPDDSQLSVELDEISAKQATLTESDKNDLRYWGAGGPNYRWTQILLKRYAKGPPGPPKSRGLKLMNLAIYDAVAAAENAKLKFQRTRPEGVKTLMSAPDTSSYPSSHAAASAAAAGVLAYLLPEEASVFAKLADASASARVNGGVNYPSDVEAGMAIGKNIAEQIVIYANDDNSDVKWSGERPMGPGNLKGEKFVYPAVGQWNMTVVNSADGYLPDAPPAHDSAEMQAELQALKDIDRTVPVSIRAWVNHSTYRAYQWWYEQAAVSIFENNLQTDALKSAHAYASISVANNDSIIACFLAKYTWWLIRPAQLDSSLSSLFPSPPHPSYPSAHSCSGASYSTVLSHFFPERADEFKAAAEEGGYSRQLAGIHYVVDHTAGVQIGDAVANDVLKHASGLLLH